MAPADPCVEFMTTHLPSGTWHSTDGSLPPAEFRDAPYVPGQRMVYGDAVDGLLLGEPAAQRGSMLFQPPAAHAATLDTGGALALANTRQMTVRLPNSAQLDLDHPNIHPVDERGQAADPESATHVFVRPGSHLGDAAGPSAFADMVRSSPAELSQRPVGDPLRDAYDEFMGLSYESMKALPADHPVRQAIDDPEGFVAQLPADGAGITQESVRKSFNDFQDNLGLYDAFWNDPEIRFAFLGYKRQLTFEFYQRQVMGHNQAAYAAYAEKPGASKEDNEEAAKNAANDAIAAIVNARFGGSLVPRFAQLMADAGALSVPHKQWLEAQKAARAGDLNFDEWLNERRDYYRDRLALWGKLNPAVADRIAQEQDQRILESTPLGAMADNILFGLPTYNDGTPGYFEFWRLASHHLVEVSGGEVVAHVFEGVMRKGVLDLTEVPALLKKIDQGQITSFKITVWKLFKTVLVPMADIYIHSQGSYDANAPKLDPKTQSKEYWAQQGRLYMQKVYRTEEMSRLGYRNSFSDVVQSVDGPPRRGGMDRDHPIFVLLEKEVDGLLQDRPKERTNSEYMDRLIAQIGNRQSPAESPTSPSPNPLTRVPTGALDTWGQENFFTSPGLRRSNTTQYSPTDEVPLRRSPTSPTGSASPLDSISETGFDRTAHPLEHIDGLVVGDQALVDRVTAANPRFAPDEYPVFMHGALLGGPDGLPEAIDDVLRGLAGDPRATGKNIVLVVCVVAVGPEHLNDAAAAFFGRLPAAYPKLTVFPTATLMPRDPEAAPHELSEVHSFQTPLRADGTFGLAANLIRTYTDAEETPEEPTGERTPMIELHPPALSLARGAGVPVTDRAGRNLPLTDDLTAQLRALGQNGQIVADVEGSITFMDPYGRGYGPPAGYGPPMGYGAPMGYAPPMGFAPPPGGFGPPPPPRGQVYAPPAPPRQRTLDVGTFRAMMQTPLSELRRLGPGSSRRAAFDQFMDMSHAEIQALPRADPMRQALADPEGIIARLPADGPGITQTSVHNSFNRFQSRLAKYDAFWDNADIRFAFLGYKRQLTFEFFQRQVEGHTAEQYGGGPEGARLANEAIERASFQQFNGSFVPHFVQLMATAGALSVPHGQWLDAQERFRGDGPGFDNWLNGRRAFYRDRLALWGKLNPAVADKIANEKDQRILESTPLGAIADDILFGLPNYNMGTPAYFEFWKLASHHLVEVSNGQVVAHVFEGVMRDGVLDSTEVPALLNKIDNGEINSFKITVWQLRGQVLVPAADYIIHSRGSYPARAPMLDPAQVSATYRSQQTRLYMQKIYRSEEMATRGYANSLVPLVEPEGGWTGRRGGTSRVHPIFVLNGVADEINLMLGDEGRRARSNSTYMRDVARQFRRQSSTSPGGSPPPQPRPVRQPTGADWDNYGFTPGPLPHVNSNNFGPLDDRRSSASSSSSGRSRRQSVAPAPYQTLYEEPEDFGIGGLSIGGRAGSQSYPPVTARAPRPPRASSNAGVFSRPKDNEFSARAGELTGDGVHPNPGAQAERLVGRPGTLLFGADHAPRAAIDRGLKLSDGVYQFSMEGVGGAGVLDGQRVTEAQVKEMILGDDQYRGQDVALVQCDPALPGTDALDSFLVNLWRELVTDPRWNKQATVFGSVGGAKVRIGLNGEGDVVAMSDTLAPDGSIRLNTGGFRSITMHPDGPAGAVVPLLRQHGTKLTDAVDEARAGGGIPLTDDRGEVVTPSRAAFLGKGLNDPVHLQRAADHQAPPPAPDGGPAATPAPAATWDLYLPDNVHQVGDNVYVVSSHPPSQTAEAKAYYAALDEFATAENPVVDAGVGRDRTVLPRDADSAKLMMLQLANRNRHPFLSTRDRPTNELLAMTTPYGSPLFHQTLAPADAGGLNLGPRFTFTLPRTDGRAQVPAMITEGLTAGLFARAKELAEPTSAVKPIDDKLGHVIWAADLAKSREQFEKANWSADEMTQHLGEVSAMSERVGNLPKVAIVKPVLEFGAAGHADLVFDYGLTEESLRGGKMMNALGDLQEAGKLGTGAADALTIDQFSSLAAAAGTRDLSVPALGLIDTALRDGDVETALRAFDQYAGQFTVPQKMDLVNGLERQKGKIPEEIIMRAIKAVLDC